LLVTGFGAAGQCVRTLALRLFLSLCLILLHRKGCFIILWK